MKSRIKVILFLSVLSLCCLACKSSGKLAKSTNVENNQLVDAKAHAMANEIMTAMGGQKKWDKLHYVSWTFFGNRHLVWDKKAGRVRIESPRDTSIYLLNLQNMTGKVTKGGREILDNNLLNEELKKAKNMWINDSYWLFMPFKLQDNGVTINYLREDTTLVGAKASVMQLTFDQVGNTPENKYEIYVTQDKLIKQWAYFKSSTQADPPRVWPWDNYQSFDGLLLSGDRSDKSGPSNIRTYSKLNDLVFESFAKFQYY